MQPERYVAWFHQTAMGWGVHGQRKNCINSLPTFCEILIINYSKRGHRLKKKGSNAEPWRRSIIMAMRWDVVAEPSHKPSPLSTPSRSLACMEVSREEFGDGFQLVIKRIPFHDHVLPKVIYILLLCTLTQVVKNSRDSPRSFLVFYFHPHNKIDLIGDVGA